MRVLAFLLLLWCTVLSAVPCCAFDGCADEECGAEQRAPAHDDEHEDCGGCSPFFACAGCSGFVVAERLVVHNVAPVEQPSVLGDGLRAGKERDYSASFWQPPRW